MERDATIMRPSGNDDFCLQVPNSSDYLIPLPDSRAIAERLLNEATCVTLPDSLPTYTLTNSHKMSDNNCWETSFTNASKMNSTESIDVSYCDFKDLRTLAHVIDLIRELVANTFHFILTYRTA
jgi:anaplastic lymphoma kinase